MKINGYALRTAIRNRETERDVALSTLRSSLTSGGNSSPEEILGIVEKCERDIAKLQSHQARYNMEVMIDLDGEIITMAEAIKRVGGIERLAAEWKNLAHRIPAGIALAAARIDASMAVEMSKRFATEASNLRRKMSSANGTEIEILDLEENLVE